MNLSIKEALLYLIQLYVSRQILVQQIMQDLRPDKLVLADKSISDEDMLVIAVKYKDAPHVGVHHDWKYFMHGRGCRIVNLVTGEPIEWDAPQVEVFDRYWFITWLRWCTNADKLSEELKDLQNLEDDYIFQLLLELEQSGNIVCVNPRYSTKFLIIYSLIPK